MNSSVCIINSILSHLRVVACLAYRHLLHGKRGDPWVDCPEVNDKTTRVAGPFVVGTTIAPAQVLDTEKAETSVCTQSLDAAVGKRQLIWNTVLIL